ncbi:MAG: Fe-S cluster assembly protein HesB [Candidatus Leucobacter sulfamidivorax]|nr:Fe-S cluster assembly protein HesB [Candidatus Leucobacter sulfamidivorax]
MTLYLTDDAAANELLTDDPLALLIGMLLDQQVAMELAFAGPLKIKQRLSSLNASSFDAESIAGAEPEAFAELFKQSPAVHRFPGSMAARVQSLAQTVLDDWGGNAAAIWTEGEPDGPTVLKRLKGLPGFGEQKARIFLALLGKQCGFDGAGWREASAPYGAEGSHRSVADIVSPETLLLVRESKRAAKAAAKAKKG